MPVDLFYVRADYDGSEEDWLEIIASDADNSERSTCYMNSFSEIEKCGYDAKTQLKFRVVKKK